MPPGLGFAVLAVPAHGHQRGPTGLARLPSPLSSLSLPLTKRSPGSPGEGQEHACGRGCARSQHPRNPGTRGGPEPPLCEPTGGGDSASRPATGPPSPHVPAGTPPSHPSTPLPCLPAAGGAGATGRSPGAGTLSTCAAGPWRPRLSSLLSRWRGAGRSPPGSSLAQCPAGRGWRWGWEAGWVLHGSAGNSRREG